MDAETKTCSKCGGEPKPLDAFCNGRGQSQCKACKRAYDSSRYAANTEKVLAMHKAYYEANREKVLATNKAWRELNAEKVSKKNKDKYGSNKEKIIARSKEWAGANPEKVRLIKKSSEKNARVSLGDSYIKKLFIQDTQIKAVEVPQFIIDLTRVQVQITRELKELNNAPSKSNKRI